MRFLLNGDRSRCVKVAAAVILVVGYSHVSSVTPDSGEDVIATGERLVHNLDCNVCHTPKIITPQGPQPDSARLLSGHPADEKLPPIPEGVIGKTGWGGFFNTGLTAWAGPWGVSFGTNLTPDDDTGIGGWTEEVFVEALRTGTYQEEGRPFLPPMPTYARLTDEELHAIFVYLKSIEPVRNAVPAPLPPPPGPKEGGHPTR